MFVKLDDVENKVKKEVLNIYKKTGDLHLIAKSLRLEQTEILAILTDLGVKSRELKPHLAKTKVISDDFIVIADTHIGSTLEDMEFLYLVYEFARKNNIHHVFHAGDLLQSTMKPVDLEYMDLNKQIKHLVDEYPNFKHLKTHIVFGNHDLHAFRKNESVHNVLKNKKDFDVMGYKKAYFLWNGYLFSMHHSIDQYSLIIPEHDSVIRFHGHRHELRVSSSRLYVPTLSRDIKDYDTPNNQPGFLHVYKEQNDINVINYPIDIDNNKIKEHQKKLVLKKDIRKYHQV